jgi:hypothetical protein
MFRVCGDRAKYDGLDTICKPCASRAELRRKMGLARPRARAWEAPRTWPMIDCDRETILFLHYATSVWGQTEEGRAWLGR